MNDPFLHEKGFERLVYRGGSSSVIKNDVVSLVPSFILQLS